MIWLISLLDFLKPFGSQKKKNSLLTSALNFQSLGYLVIFIVLFFWQCQIPYATSTSKLRSLDRIEDCLSNPQRSALRKGLIPTFWDRQGEAGRFQRQPSYPCSGSIKTCWHGACIVTWVWFSLAPCKCKRSSFTFSTGKWEMDLLVMVHRLLST